MPSTNSAVQRDKASNLRDKHRTDQDSTHPTISLTPFEPEREPEDERSVVRISNLSNLRDTRSLDLGSLHLHHLEHLHPSQHNTAPPAIERTLPRADHGTQRGNGTHLRLQSWQKDTTSAEGHVSASQTPDAHTQAQGSGDNGNGNKGLNELPSTRGRGIQGLQTRNRASLFVCRHG